MCPGNPSAGTGLGPSAGGAKQPRRSRLVEAGESVSLEELAEAHLDENPIAFVGVNQHDVDNAVEKEAFDRCYAVGDETVAERLSRGARGAAHRLSYPVTKIAFEQLRAASSCHIWLQI